MTISYIEANDISMRYELTGEAGPPCVLIHEMGGTLETWDRVVPLIQQGRRVLRYDLRNCGGSETRGEIGSFDVLVEDLSALLDAVAPDQPVVLAGCAIGAAVALRFAAAHPERAAGLLLSSPALGVPVRHRDVTLNRARLAERDGMRAIVDDLLDAAYPAAVRRDGEVFHWFRSRLLGVHPNSFATVSRLLASTEPDFDADRIACPTIVAGGRHDRLRPPESSEAVARRIAGAEFKVLDCGHYLPVQSPQDCANLLDDLLSR